MGNRILYIEDNPDNMMLVRRVLESRGYQLISAMNGINGVATAEKEEVDMILLDVNLPDIDGYEVARRLRASTVKPSLSTIPIIAITANAMKGDANKVLEAGCDVYMAKPIDIRDLSAKVAAFVPTEKNPARPAPDDDL